MNEINNRGDLNLFRVMLAIAEEGTTTAAADRLHLSQSAISHALKRLRVLLNDPVFVKHGRNLVLTPHGRSILPKVEQALVSLSGCLAKSGEFDPLASQLELRLGLRDVVEVLMLPDFIRPLRDRGARLKVRSKRVALDAMEEKLLAGELDLVIDLEYPVSQKVASEEIVREKLCVLVGPHHPAYDSGELTLKAYTEGDHALVILDKKERAFVELQMGNVGAQRNVVVQCEHYQAAARVTAETDLILTLPHSYAARVQRTLDVRLLPLPFPCASLPIRMYWRSESSEEPYMIWLKQRVREGISSAIPVYDL